MGGYEAEKDGAVKAPVAAAQMPVDSKPGRTVARTRLAEGKAKYVPETGSTLLVVPAETALECLPCAVLVGGLLLEVPVRPTAWDALPWKNRAAAVGASGELWAQQD